MNRIILTISILFSAGALGITAWSYVQIQGLTSRLGEIEQAEPVDPAAYVRFERPESAHQPLELLRLYYPGKFQPFIDNTIYLIDHLHSTHDYYTERAPDLLASIEIAHFIEKDNLAVALVRLKDGLTEYHDAVWFEKVEKGWLLAPTQYFSEYSEGRLSRGKTDWIKETSSIVKSWDESGEDLP